MLSYITYIRQVYISILIASIIENDQLWINDKYFDLSSDCLLFFIEIVGVVLMVFGLLVMIMIRCFIRVSFIFKYNIQSENIINFINY